MASQARTEEDITLLREELSVQAHTMASHLSRLEKLVQERLGVFWNAMSRSASEGMWLLQPYMIGSNLVLSTLRHATKSLAACHETVSPVLAFRMAATLQLNLFLG